MKITVNEQKAINADVMNAYHAANKERIWGDCTNWKRLRYCAAEVCETETYYILRSYNTIVAVIDKGTHVLFDALRVVYGYTTTSAQHIIKFAHDYGAEELSRAYPV